MRKTGRNILRQWAVSIFAFVVLPFLLLSSAEWALRALHYGYSRALFRTAPAPHRSFSIINTGFYSRFFPKTVERDMALTMNWGFAIPKTKSPDTCRIFVFGSSAALGDVPAYAFSFSRIIEVMLQAAFPDKRFEIYNVACCSINSHVMRLAALECAKQAPDFFVVYMGNNEFIGPFGPGWSPPSQIPPKARWVATRLALQQLRLYQAAEPFGVAPSRLLTSIAEDPLKIVAGLTKFRSNSPGREAMYENYAQNLGDICRSAHRVGAQTVLCTVTSNIRDLPPFGSLHKEGLSEADRMLWEDQFSKGIAAQERAVKDGPDALREARDHFEQAEKIDETYPDLQYRLGRCFWELEDYPSASKAFALARDNDCLPLRANNRINEIITRTASDWAFKGALLADICQRINASSPHGVAGNGLFHDFVHFLFPGHYQAASSIFDALKGSLGRPDATALTEEECKRQLGMSPYLYARHLRLALDELESYHKVDSEIHTEWLHALVAQADAVLTPDSAAEARRILEEAITRRPKDFHLRRTLVEVLRDSNHSEDALRKAKALVSLYDERPDAHVLLSDVLEQMGKKEEAMEERKGLGGT